MFALFAISKTLFTFVASEKKQDAMNKAERQQLILNRLAIEHHIYIGELCEKLGRSGKK